MPCYDGRTYHMIAHGHEQIEEQPPAGLHLHLHRTTTLERVAGADDKRQVVCSELRVRLGRVVIGIPRTRQDGRALDARLQPLLAQRQPLQLLQPVPLGGTVDQRVLEQSLAHRRVVRRALDATALAVCGIVCIFELPGILPLIMEEARVVVALVEELEHRREDLGDLLG